MRIGGEKRLGWDMAGGMLVLDSDGMSSVWSVQMRKGRFWG